MLPGLERPRPFGEEELNESCKSSTCQFLMPGKRLKSNQKAAAKVQRIMSSHSARERKIKLYNS
jgi:hypothetical protein